jgi:hypothetical protein
MLLCHVCFFFRFSAQLQYFIFLVLHKCFYLLHFYKAHRIGIFEKVSEISEFEYCHSSVINLRCTFDPLRPEAYLCNIFKFSSYRTRDKLRLLQKTQQVNNIYGSNRCIEEFIYIRVRQQCNSCLLHFHLKHNMFQP